jgi:SAM-dependent methyltransferase
MPSLPRHVVEATYAPGEYAEQESLMRASEIRALAQRAQIGPGVSVLDLCCGVAGPGRLIARELGCEYLGVDADPGSIATARERAAGLSCRFEVARIPPVPRGPFDVVLLLETMLAFPDKDTLIQGIAATLAPGGRFAFTLEEGAPLTQAERARMPNADTVWLVPLDELVAALARAGLAVTWREDHSRAHRETAAALAGVYDDPELVASHRLWAEWLEAGRVRKLALVATRVRARVPPGAIGTRRSDAAR